VILIVKGSGAKVYQAYLAVEEYSSLTRCA
jgi:hypothetical protein